MIANATDYQTAHEELHDLEQRLQRVQQAYPVGSKGFTKVGIRKMIARVHEGLAVYEVGEKATQSSGLGSCRIRTCASTG